MRSSVTTESVTSPRAAIGARDAREAIGGGWWLRARADAAPPQLRLALESAKPRAKRAAARCARHNSRVQHEMCCFWAWQALPASLLTFSPLATSTMIEEERQAALVAWLEGAGGYIHPRLDLCAGLGNGDRGAVARQAIKEGDALLLVPRHLCLSTTHAAAGGGAQVRRRRAGALAGSSASASCGHARIASQRDPGCARRRTRPTTALRCGCCASATPPSAPSSPPCCSCWQRRRG